MTPRIEEELVWAVERLNDISRRLDELSDSGPDELQALSQELGRVSDRLASVEPPTSEAVPDWLERMRRHMEQSAEMIIAERYGKEAVLRGQSSVAVNIPLFRQTYYQPNTHPFNTQTFKVL